MNEECVRSFDVTGEGSRDAAVVDVNFEGRWLKAAWRIAGERSSASLATCCGNIRPRRSWVLVTS